MSMSGVDGSYREQLVRRELSASAHKSIHSLPLNILQLILFVSTTTILGHPPSICMQEVFQSYTAI